MAQSMRKRGAQRRIAAARRAAEEAEAVVSEAARSSLRPAAPLFPSELLRPLLLPAALFFGFLCVWCAVEDEGGAWGVQLLDAAAGWWARLSGGATAAAAATLPPFPLPYVCGYEVVATLPHERSAFTQGLVFDGAGALYESVGGFDGDSAVRTVNLTDGSSLARTPNAPDVFGEGVAVLNETTLVQLSWQNGRVFEYSLPELVLQRDVRVSIGREGWGLATDGETLFVTDSGDSLYHVEPHTYRVLRVLPIVDAALPCDPRYHDCERRRRVRGVNELEWVGGELWGNVYPMYQNKASECVVRIDARTGRVLGWLDLRGLFGRQRAEVTSDPMNYVLNGIAYHAPSSRLLVTGKRWDAMYALRVVPQPGLGAEHVAAVCSLG